MSLRMFAIPLLLLTATVQRGISSNIGHVTMPLFEMLAKDLPQDEEETAGEYIDVNNQQKLTEFFDKVRAYDIWKTDRLLLEVILRDEATTFVKSGRVQFDRNTHDTAILEGFNCTRYCYNVSVQAILSANNWTEDRLDGKEQPIVDMGDIHNALVKAIEERFCCNMTEIAISLGMDPVTGVRQTAAELDVWKRFVPHINNQTIQCKADELQVTSSELAELLRTDQATLKGYDLNQMDLQFFPAYEDLLRRKNLFETRSIATGGLIQNWQSSTMAQFAQSVSQFSPRDLQILYRWQAPQIFAIENIPMSIFESGCTTVSLIDSLFTLSQTLFGYSGNLPNCDVAFLLSRSFDEVSTKFTTSSLLNQNALEIFRTSNGNSSWFDIYQLLQLNIAEGIWVETPTLTQVATFSAIALDFFTAQNSIPMAIRHIKTFNTTSTLNTIMSINYNSFLTTLLDLYGYTSSSLVAAASITLAQLNSLTIQEAHNLVIDSIQSRYRISDVASLLGIAQVDTHVLINLPSFEWQRIVSAAIQNAFSQSADAYSVLLSAGGVQIATITGGFQVIQVSDSVTYNTDRITPTELASCLGKQLSEIHAMTFAQYHQLHTNNIVPLLRMKLEYEMQTMEDLLTSKGQNFDDIKSRTVAEVITLLTGMTIQNLQCLYGWSSTFTNTDLAITFQNANETRLCNDFLGRTMFDIVQIISQTPSKVCFLCTTDPCGANTMCRDVPDSFVCTCIGGYTGNPEILNQGCVDIPECLIRVDNCHDNATCMNTPGSFECSCNEGFTGNGTDCQDINECFTNPQRCGPNGVCRNTVGSFFCECVSGYRWNGSTCVDIDECAEGLDNCDPNADCTNTVGSYTCSCPAGLTGDGFNCQDILECSNFQAGAFPCHARADCIETFGSYLCRCMIGYSGDGQMCTDIDECGTNTDDCHVNATCFNTDPSFFCACNQGFTGNGRQCDDINECNQNLDNCHVNADCFNTIGSFYCDCKNGFNGNGTYCYVAEVSFAKATATVIEGEDVVVSFSLNGRIDSIAFVTIQVTGSATENTDYNAFTKNFLFNPGDESTKEFTIRTSDDERLEGSENITLTLSSVTSHVTPGSIPSMTITIIDNDAIGVAFSAQTYSVNEDDNSANIIIQIQSGIVERDIIVSLGTISGTALPGADYTTHNAQLTFSPGNAGPKLVQIPLVDNDRVEGDEHFNVSLTTTDPDANILNSPATIRIIDDDVATVKFKSNAYQVNEGGRQIIVGLDVTGVRDISLTARLSTTNAGATAEQDFTGILNKDITIPPSVTEIFETISISEDGILENNETFSITVASRSTPHLVTDIPANTVVTIVDNDVVSVRFSQSPYSTEEEFTQVNVRVIVTGQLERAVQLSLSTMDQAANQPNDYQQKTETLTFSAAGLLERDVSIQILEDNIVENTETLLVRLTTTDADVIFPNGETAVISILDDDSATVYIPNDEYTFNEDDVTTNIPIMLQGNIAIPVTVRISTNHDTALWPSDFTEVTNHEVVFNPGETSTKQLTLNIVDDNDVESTEQFSVILSTVDANVQIGTHENTTVYIMDNDRLRVRFSSSHYEADEDSGFALVSLVLEDALQTTLNVRLTPSNGTATEPEDFPLITYTVALEAGQPRTIPYRVNITNDLLEEYSEHFFLTLSNIDAKVEIVEPSIANITIGESDDIYFCDPNARRYPCHIKADCADVPGTFVCTCVQGYEGDGKICTNIDECNSITCPFNATCQDTVGSYRCICKDGFRGDGVNCVDINECNENTDECDDEARCENTLGSYECICNEGWFGTGRVCSDVNECNQTNECHSYATCTNNVGSYDCECRTGFRGDGRISCIDIDECTERSDNCHEQATCTNNIGSFTCQCNSGWHGNGTHCTDINECSQPDLNDCDSNNGTCFNNQGSFTCTCNTGFTGDGKICIDFNECLENTDNCPGNSVCQNTIGSFECNCNPGFSHQGSICEDVDECNNSNSHNCHNNANCLNNPGSYECECKDGYTGDGRTVCSNIDECAADPSPCHPNAYCNDTNGSFFCTCKPGFTGNGLNCEDIIDCILLPRQYPCDIRASCIDVPGTFRCTCPSGFTLNADQTNCDDINECVQQTYNCHENASCVNTQGSYRCECKTGFAGDGVNNCVDTTCTIVNPCSSYANCSVNITMNSFDCICHHGFEGDGFTCNEIDECSLSSSPCGPSSNCQNTPRGSYTCTCENGFSGDPPQVTCVDNNECMNFPCHVNATCNNLPGSFECDCYVGFTGDGFACTDINECNSSATCDENAQCTNTIGSYYCTCNNGFTGNGKSCEDINECEDLSNCPENSDCNNSAGSFSCECKDGYMEVNERCEDINECNLNPCTEDGAVCTNTPGSYTCTCPEELYNNGNFCYVFCPFKLDLAFIVDTSDSIDANNFEHIKQFLINTIGRMEIGPTGNHIAAISFGNVASIFMRFNTITGANLNRPNLRAQFANFPKNNGVTRIDRALLRAESDIFTEANGMRTAADIRKVAVVITDGAQTIGPGSPIEPLAHIARRLQSKDITVIAIAVGQEVPRSQLLNLTNFIEENILEVDNFANLTSVINRFVNTSCTDYNECELYDDVCHGDANCKDTLGAYNCQCKTGYAGDGFACEDINECASMDDNDCDDVNGMCSNNVGSYTCQCNAGYTGDGTTCSVLPLSYNCDANADCSDTVGNYTCTCRAGFSGDGRDCTNVDECNDGSNNCDANADCSDTVGNYTCTCRTGFSGDGRDCTNLRCGNACHSNAECVQEGQNYRCQCLVGYSGNGTSCTNINECVDGSNNCHANAECNDTEGSYTCSCRTGFSGDGRDCANVDECVDGSNNCHANAECNDTVGSYTCTCRTGFSGDGSNCANINECDGSHGCDQNGTCQDNVGSYTCTCNSGFTGDGRTCTVLSACGNCPDNSQCVNVVGTLECQCNPGYTKNATDNRCYDLNECASSSDHNCSAADQACRNYPGAFECFCSSPGKFLINGACEDVSSVILTIEILNEIFNDAYANANSAEFYTFVQELQQELFENFRALYGSDFIDSVVLNLSNGSVIAEVLLLFKPNKVPGESNLNSMFASRLDSRGYLNSYEISRDPPSQITDYDECNPMLAEHKNDCPQNSYCKDAYGSYTCECASGYEKHSTEFDFCVSEDDDWWLVYAVVFGAIGLVLVFLILSLCCLEINKSNKERYTLHEERAPHDKRIDEEVAPGFPGSVPRTSSTGSQLLLGSEKGYGGEKLAMYEVNPIYDSTNG